MPYQSAYRDEQNEDHNLLPMAIQGSHGRILVRRPMGDNSLCQFETVGIVWVGSFDSKAIAHAFINQQLTVQWIEWPGGQLLQRRGIVTLLELELG